MFLSFVNDWKFLLSVLYKLFYFIFPTFVYNRLFFINISFYIFKELLNCCIDIFDINKENQMSLIALMQNKGGVITLSWQTIHIHNNPFSITLKFKSIDILTVKCVHQYKYMLALEIRILKAKQSWIRKIVLVKFR